MKHLTAEYHRVTTREKHVCRKYIWKVFKIGLDDGEILGEKFCECVFVQNCRNQGIIYIVGLFFS